MTGLKEEILEILTEDARTPIDKMSIMLGRPQEEIAQAIQELEQDLIILKYSANINREKADHDLVEAVIEVRVTPQRDRGFASIARRIYNFEEVRAVYLMSGGYDLQVQVEGHSLREVASFVSERLSTIEGVLSTATHFVLKKYKADGVIMDDEVDDRLVVSP